MSQSTLEKTEGSHYVVAQIGEWQKLAQYKFTLPAFPDKVFPGKIFLKDALSLSSMEISVNVLGAGHSMPFYHTHRQHEEVYFFINGKGQFQVDGEVIDIREGTVISVKPNGKRTWRNNSTENLYYIVIQAECNSLSGDTTKDGVMTKDPVSWP